MRILLALSLGLILLCGCAANAGFLRDNPDLALDAQIIAESYLDGQMQGESHDLAIQKYGAGVIEFSGIQQYSCEGLSQDSALRFKIQSIDQTGAAVWKNYDLGFVYSERNGPVIQSITEVR